MVNVDFDISISERDIYQIVDQISTKIYPSKRVICALSNSGDGTDGKEYRGFVERAGHEQRRLTFLQTQGAEGADFSVLQKDSMVHVVLVREPMLEAVKRQTESVLKALCSSSPRGPWNGHWDGLRGLTGF